ncbi:MAG: hemolysin family protein [Ornithinimicrobium sp.]|uniref:hemolysin family protein n=1 Tax=Ornithinimicrobium sp. TaxID=1977084 RepID=UPI003D9B5A6F
MTEWLLLACAVLLIGANALFVAAEFSLVSVDRATVERRTEAGDRRAGSLLAALRTLSTQLSGAQLGITVTSLVVGFLAEPSIATIVREPLGAVGVPAGAVGGVSFTLAFVLATGSQMIFGELVPKNWAIAEPLRVGRAVVGAQRGFTFVARPLIRLLNGAANRILRSLGIEPQEELASARSPGELASLATRSAQEGTLEASTADLLTRSIEFGDRRAGDVMTPRPRVTFLAAADPLEAVLRTVVRTGHAAFPVTGKDVDDIVGVVHFKHVLAVPVGDRSSTSVREVVREMPAVPDSMELDPLLAVVRRSGHQMALVVDEYGGTDGIVTLEDLVEEIVGDIQDEQDKPVGRSRRLPDGGWTLSGLLRPDEIEDLTRIELPEAEESDTVGGLLIERFGALPQVGDEVHVEARAQDDVDDDGIPATVVASLSVTRMDGRRVDRVLLRLVSEQATAQEQGSSDE